MAQGSGGAQRSPVPKVGSAGKRGLKGLKGLKGVNGVNGVNGVKRRKGHGEGFLLFLLLPLRNSVS